MLREEVDMVSTKTPRVFNLYEIIGVFFPGTALLVGLFIIIPGLPTPNSIIPYLGFIIVSFSFGHILQSYASLSVGNLKVFDETIRNVQSPIDSPDSSDDEGTDEGDTEGKTDENDNDEAEPDTDTEEVDGSERSNPFWLYLLYPLVGPIFWPLSSPNGGAIEELRNPNTVWKHLSENYEFDLGSTRYEEMLQLISSRIDDPRSPTRSYRFQAIRNFQRGMWLTAWILFVILFGTSLYCGIPSACNGGEHLLAQSYLLSNLSVWLSLVLGGITVLVFWLLTVQYERLFVRFLINDYVVLINQNDQDRIRIVEDY